MEINIRLSKTLKLLLVFLLLGFIYRASLSLTGMLGISLDNFDKNTTPRMWLNQGLYLSNMIVFWTAIG